MVSFLVPNYTVIQVLRALQACVWLAVFIAFGGSALESFSRTYPTPVDYVAVGITLTSAGISLGGFWFLAWHLSGRPQWMVNSDPAAFILLLVIAGGCMCVTAPGAVDGAIPRKSWIRTGIAFGLGMFAGTLLAIYNPNLSDWIGMIEPMFQGK